MSDESTQRVLQFVETNLIGRTVASSPVSTVSDNDRTEITYVDQNFFSDLVSSSSGFAFNLTSIARGHRYGLSEKSEKSELAGSLDAVRVYRYEMTERVSTGRLLGFARFISSTNVQFDPLAGTVFQVQMWMDTGDLVVADTQIGYGDFPAPGGERRPVALDGTYRYTIKDERLYVAYDQATFDVDPTTLRRNPTGIVFPTQYSTELVDSDGELLAT